MKEGAERSGARGKWNSGGMELGGEKGSGCEEVIARRRVRGGGRYAG